MAIAFILVLMPLLGDGTRTDAALPQISSTLDASGFPDWYADSNGTRLDPCLDVADFHCTLAPTPGVFDTQQPIVFPTNFPDEFFYFAAESDKLKTPGCAGAADPLAANPGKAFVVLALEGAFTNGLPAVGEQEVFGRVRIVVRGGLCPSTSYTFTHPYGTTTLTTDESGSIKPVAGTVDIGCFPVAPQTCNFAQAFSSPVLTTGFLRWDPAVLPLADPGYLGGDPGVLHRITGGVNNVFTVADGATGLPIVSTNLFSVAGRLAGPLASSPARVDFGGQNTGTTSIPATVTVTNVDASPLTISSLALAGANAGEFALAGGSCAPGVILARDAACTIDVSFAPATTGVRSAQLAIAHNSGLGRSPFRVSLQGTGTTTGQQPVLSVSPTLLDFGSVRVGTQSALQTLTVTDIGDAPLQVTRLDFVNTAASFNQLDKDAFRIPFNTCLAGFVPPGAGCTLSVAFQPTNAHPYAAALKVSANTSGGPVEVTLNAVGIGGVAAVSPVIDPTNGYPTWYQDEAGIRLGPCLDPDDPFCGLIPDGFYTGGPVIGLPTFANFPEEFFYYAAESDGVPTPGCGGSAPGHAFVVTATEAAFTNGAPTPGEQEVFGRTRIVVKGGLCPDTTYTFTHPYGQVDVTTDAAGGVKPNAATQDIGCFPIAPEVCDFRLALTSPVSGGYLTAANAPAGYLGDPAVFATVTGSPFIPPDDPGNPANYFRVNLKSTGELIGRTDLFSVMGKLAGPLVADPRKLAFGTVPVGTTSLEQSVRFTNEGRTDLTVNTVTVTGPMAAEYTITNNGCNGHVLSALSVDPGKASCTVRVRFAPSATGKRSATLAVNHTGRNSPLHVALSGIGGAPAGQPAISVEPAAVSFPDLHTGQVSASSSVRVSNLGGSAGLVVGPVGLAGSGASNFSYTNHCTAAVAPGDECTIDVRFNPLAAGALAASLDIASNAGPALSVSLSGRGFSGTTAQSAGLTDSGFPSWFQDDNGVRVAPCLEAADPNCIVLGDAGFNPAQPLAFPANFPEEFFYWTAESDFLTIPPDPSCGGAGGSALLVLALEAAFGGAAVPADGDQIWFGRVRVFIRGGLCPNTTYTFTHPYGATTITSDGSGAIPANRGTEDLTNVLAVRPLMGGLLRWDPNVGPAAPAGYLGDGRSPHPVVGSRYRPAGPGTEPANYFRIDGGGLSDVRTSNFIVSGRIAGPMVAGPGSLDFPSQPVGTASPSRTVTVTNVTPTAIGNITPVLTGTDAGAFSITGGTCSPATSLPLDGSCTVEVAFTPASPVGTKTASLRIGYAGLRSPIAVTLSGTATPGSTAQIQLDKTGLAFGSLLVNSTSAAQTVTITDTGTDPLDLTAITIVGANPGDFQQINDCTRVNPAVAPTSCTVQVTFRPTSIGSKSAQIRVASNDPVRPAVTVSLSGTGVAPIAAVSPTSLSFSTGAGGSSTQSLKITNTGSAPFSLLGSPALVISNQSPLSSPLKFRASNSNCTNVAPGKSCTIQVTFAPGAGPKNETFTAILTILSNAANGPQAVSLTGIRK